MNWFRRVVPFALKERAHVGFVHNKQAAFCIQAAHERKVSCARKSWKMVEVFNGGGCPWRLSSGVGNCGRNKIECVRGIARAIDPWKTQRKRGGKHQCAVQCHAGKLRCEQC